MDRQRGNYLESGGPELMQEAAVAYIRLTALLRSAGAAREEAEVLSLRTADHLTLLFALRDVMAGEQGWKRSALESLINRYEALYTQIGNILCVHERAGAA